jgi:regulator of protease activity HflC (stomatin/prohibitin superfamily)
VERLGKFQRSLNAGLNFILPFVERISFEDTLREQVLDVPPQECFTLDNAPLTADAIVYMKINNMIDACYQVSNLRNAVLNLCLTQVREEVGRLTLEESFSSRGELSRRLVTTLNAICQKWGLEITRVEIQHLQPSPEILRSLELQISAERKKRAAILQSEGEKTKLINEAQGKAGALLADSEARKKSIILASQAEAERQRIEAEGIKMAIQSLATAISTAGGSYKTQNGQINERAMQDALQLLSLVRYLETQGKFASKDGTKVLMFPSKDR